MGGNNVALKAGANNKFVCADNYGNNPLIANRTNAAGWETFEMTPVGGSDDFSLVVIPDSQFMTCYYHGGTPAMFERQIQWVADHVHDSAMNIAFVSHVGDITDNGAAQYMWDSAKNAMFKLDGVVPYAMAPGNHDSMVMWNGDYTLLNQNIPVSKYASQSWFGGTYQSGKYENNYELFSAAGMDFIIIHMAWNPSAAVRAWASGVLKRYPNRRAIISTHEYLLAGGTVSDIGNNIWNDLVKSNSNVFLVVCGHDEGESKVTWNNNAGQPVYQVLTDFQGENPQVGRLRYYTFRPSHNCIDAWDYSADTNVKTFVFSVPYRMR